MLILMWIISLIVTNVIAITATIYVKNVKHRVELAAKTHFAEEYGWSTGYDIGSRTALDDASSVWAAYHKKFGANPIN